MNIDISRVNLLEKDVEDWLYENPGAMPAAWDENHIERWIGRQYALPSGIADLVGLREDKRVVVVEVKNVPINKAAVLQVCRYQNDLKHILSARMNYPHIYGFNEPEVDMILVGPSVDSQTFGEAYAVGVEVITFEASVTLHVSRLAWTRDHRDAVGERQNAIAAQPEWNIFGRTVTEQVELDMIERQRAGQTDFDIEQVTEEYDDLLDAITEQPEE